VPRAERFPTTSASGYNISQFLIKNTQIGTLYSMILVEPPVLVTGRKKCTPICIERQKAAGKEDIDA